MKNTLKKFDIYTVMYPIIICGLAYMITELQERDSFNLWIFLGIPVFYIGVVVVPKPRLERLLDKLNQRMDDAAELDSPRREQMMWLVAQRNANDCGGASIADSKNAKFWQEQMLYWDGLRKMHHDDYMRLCNQPDMLKT